MKAAATRPWLKLVFGPWRAKFSTVFERPLGCSSVVDVGNAISGMIDAVAHRRATNFDARANRSTRTKDNRELESANQPSGAAPSRPWHAWESAERTCGVRLAWGGGKLAPQFCARGGGAGLPSAHQRGATSAKKRRTHRRPARGSRSPGASGRAAAPEELRPRSPLPPLN